MKKFLLLVLTFSFIFVSANTIFSLNYVVSAKTRLEPTLQTKVDKIFLDIEKRILNKDISYKKRIYDKILKKVQLIYNRYPDLSWKSLLLVQYIEKKAEAQKSSLPLDVVLGWISNSNNLYKPYPWEYIFWNKDAKISFIEYSDIECPFCARLHSSGTIEKILKKYEWKVNFKFKHFPLAFHRKSNSLANSAECAGEQWWANKYYDFIFLAFKRHAKLYSEYYITDIVKDIWLNKEKFDICLRSEKYNEKIIKQTQEWVKLWVTWTPWNVLVNNETWNFKIISWAYPFDKFVDVIDEMLK